MPTLRLFCTRGPTVDSSPTPSSTLIFPRASPTTLPFFSSSFFSSPLLLFPATYFWVPSRDGTHTRSSNRARSRVLSRVSWISVPNRLSLRLEGGRETVTLVGETTSKSRGRFIRRGWRIRMEEAAPSAIQSPPPEVWRCFVSLALSLSLSLPSPLSLSLSLSLHPDRGPYHPRGRRTGRHRVKSGRAIISPLAAFEVYIPSRHLRSLREA